MSIASLNLIKSVLLLSSFALLYQANALAAEDVSILGRGPDGAVVTANDITADMERIPPEVRNGMKVRPASIQQLVNNLIIRRILAKHAENDGVPADPVVSATITIAREKVLSDAYIAKLDQQNEPTEAALDAYAKNQYQVNAAKFLLPAQTRARHILLTDKGSETLAKANELLSQLRAGASFEELAMKNSEDAGNAAKGGDLGFFSEGKMVKSFEDAVNALKNRGDLSEPVKTQFGYHIIRLEERQAERRQTYDEVRPKLIQDAKAAILSQKRLEKIQAMAKDISINDAAIDAFTKQGAK